MKSFYLSVFLLSQSLGVAAAEDFSISEDSLSYPDNYSFMGIELLQRYVENDTGSEIRRLTEIDYKEIAEQLDVEVAVIKAVVDIETGRRHEGFCAPGKPLIDFDTKVFRRFCARKGISLSGHAGTLSGKIAGASRQEAEHRRLELACVIDSVTAVESTFWGMFQIGGFNWKLCGAETIHDFVKRMRKSERSQLEMFAGFITNTGLVKYLKSKNWSAFAYRYNGPKYAANGYHTRLARAYYRHSKSQ